MRWRFWPEAIARAGVHAPPARTVPGTDEIRASLERRGVPTAFSAALAERTADQIARLEPSEVEAMLDGIALAFDLQQSTQDQLSRSLKGLREVERMMGAFSGELSKLDEVLGVLAAYVRRMKTSGKGTSDRVLH